MTASGWGAHNASPAKAEPATPAEESPNYAELSLEELLQIPVVTASRTEEDRSLAPAMVHVVTRDEIKRRAYQSLAELLSNVPGLYVVDDFTTPTLSVRGVTGGLKGGTRIVRIMIDGVQVNFRPDLTAFIGPEYIPMEVIERVEIAKGPLSALYGANAFLATVNVITRTPKEGAETQAATRYSHLRNSGGSASGSFAYGGEHASLLGSAVLGQLDRSGLALDQTFAAQKNTPDLFNDSSRYDLSRPLGAFAVLRTKSEMLGSLTVEGGLQHMDSSGEFQVNSLYSHRSRLAINNWWSNARWDRSWPASLQTSASIGWSQGAPTRDTQLFLPRSPAIEFVPKYGYNALTGQAELRWTPIEALSLALGADGERDDERILYYTETFNADIGAQSAGDRVDIAIDPGTKRHVLLTDIGAFLQANATPFGSFLPDLRLTGNVRVDSIKQGDIGFPLQLSWRGAASYRFSSAVSAKIVAGRAFQAPSAVLMFARPGYGNIGNIVGSAAINRMDPLLPQTVTSVEASTTAQLFEVIGLELGAYYQDVGNRIEFSRYNNNFRATNLAGASRNIGAEATLRYAKSPVNAYSNVSLQRTIIDGEISSQPPTSYPNAFGTVGADVFIPQGYLSLSAASRWATARGASQGNIWFNNDTRYSLPGYALLDFTISTVGVKLLGKGCETNLVLGGRNIINTRINEPGYGGFDIPGLGRTVFVELRVQQ